MSFKIIVTEETNQKPVTRWSTSVTMVLGEAVTKKMSGLPQHIQDLLYGQEFVHPQTQRVFNTLGYIEPPVMEFYRQNNVRTLPWDRDNKVTKKISTTTAKTVYHRMKKSTMIDNSDGDIHKYREFEQIIDRSQFGKMQFMDVVTTVADGMPVWVVTRLETACRSCRFELPFNRKHLEGMTPLQFLANQTRLHSDQSRRYVELNKKYKSKYNEYNLYPALNFMFGGLLSAANYDVLRVCLFITEDVTIDVHTFTGLCALADRLFWTCYLDYAGDTFLTWAPNRSALEYVDFENLDRKLEGVKLSREMDVLLHSLA
ncbi:hypothetical protein Btru_074585 [Bulinus truncatus]|nr:hypothetical protein Btru_074585 [Bulinus truncatus]